MIQFWKPCDEKELSTCCPLIPTYTHSRHRMYGFLSSIDQQINTKSKTDTNPQTDRLKKKKKTTQKSSVCFRTFVSRKCQYHVCLHNVNVATILKASYFVLAWHRCWESGSKHDNQRPQIHKFNCRNQQ